MVFLLPAISALFYALGAHILKRAMGVGMWRVTFLCNMAMAVFYLPLLLLPSEGQGAWAWYEPIVTGALFFFGQVFTFRAIQSGDVSVATPVLGTKALFVTALASVLTSEPPPLTTWLAAALTALAIALLGISKREQRSKLAATVLLASISALFFAAADVLIQRWAPGWGASRYIALMFLVNGILSFALIPKFSAPLKAIPRQTWNVLILGCVLIVTQTLGMAITMAVFGRAPEANIIYGSRGLWSVLIVLVAARYLDHNERSLGRRTLLARLAGSVLLIIAIALIL